MVEEKPEIKPDEKIETETKFISSTESIIERADAVAKRMEEANKKSEELLAKSEAIAARMMLSGRSEAGISVETPEEKQKKEIDEKAKEIVNRFKM